MAGFIHFWKMTPADYFALTIPQSNALFRWMDEYNRTREQQHRRQVAQQRRNARRGR